MVARILLGLFAVMCLHLFTEGALTRFDGSDRKYVEGYDDPRLDCNVNSTATVRWTLVNETGATLHLGTCYGRDNCTSPYSSSDLQVGHNGWNTFVKFFNIASQFSGVVTCQETLINGNVRTDTGQLNLTRVSFISAQIDIPENEQGSIDCYNSPFNSSTVTWSLTTTSGQTLDLGFCTTVNTCISPRATDFVLRRSSNTKSTLYFQNLDRSKGRQLFCSFTYNGLRETVNMTLNLYSSPKVGNCHGEVSLQNWSTILSCDIISVFSSSGYYYFRVKEFFLNRWNPYRTQRYVFDGRLSYRDMLTPFTSSNDSKVYYRGNLTYSWPLSPTPDRSYEYLVVWFYFGDFENINALGAYQIDIWTPSNPTHNCNDLIYIPETGDAPCVCTTDSLGSPAGRLIWLLGNVIIATGDYGVKQLTFPSGKVSRQHDGVMVTCQLDWVQPINTTFTLHVDPTPSQPTHNCSGLIYIPETGVVPCVCTADYLGSPAGRLVWLLGNVTIATGDYGGTQLTFPSGQVSRQHDGMIATCQLDWVKPINAVFACHVAYGPDRVSLEVNLPDAAIPNGTVHVISHVSGMKPMTSDMVQWGGLCQGQQGFTCILTQRAAADVDGKTVTCRVINGANNRHSAEASAVIIGQLSDTGKQEGATSMSPVLIGSIIGGVVAFLLVVVIVVLAVVVYRRLQRPDSSRREKQEDEHDYSSLTPAGRHAASGHSGQQNGVELRGLDLDLTNPPPEYNIEQNERPVSEYDVIYDDNPEIASHLEESSLAKEQPDYISMREDRGDYLTPCSPPVGSEDKNDSDYLTPYSPRPNSDGQEREDYITPCSTHDSGEDKNASDYLTPCSVKENLRN